MAGEQDQAPTARMISEEPTAPAVEPDADPADAAEGDGRVWIEVETRRRLTAEPVVTSTAHAGVTGPDDDAVIVVEHAQEGGSYSFVMNMEQARGLRRDLLNAIQEWHRLTDEQS